MAHLVVLFLLVFLCSTEGKEAQGKNQSHHENIMEGACLEHCVRFRVSLSLGVISLTCLVKTDVKYRI